MQGMQTTNSTNASRPEFSNWSNNHCKLTYKIWRKDYILLTQSWKKLMKKSAEPNLDKLELDAKPNSELWLFGRNAEWFLLKAAWRRSSTERNAACQHFFKTRAAELVEKLTKLWQMYSLYSALALGDVGQFRICSTCGCGLRAPCAKRKIKKRELTFKQFLWCVMISPWWRVQELVKPGFSKLSSTKRLNGFDMAWQCLAQLTSVCQVNGLL